MRRQHLWAAVLFLAALSTFAGVGWLAAQAGLLSAERLFYAEKSLLALKGRPPRLENIGLVYPPLPFFVSLLVQSPLLAGAVPGAAMVTLLLARLARTGADPLLRLSFLVYLLLSPAAVFLFSQKPATALFYTLFTWGGYLLVRFLESQATSYLFAFGLVYGLSFLSGFESVLLFPYYLTLLVWFLGMRQPVQLLSVLLVCFLPIGFVVGTWVFLNWMLTGDGWHFLHSAYSYFYQAYRSGSTEVLLFAGEPRFALVQAAVRSWPWALPYYALFPFLIKRGLPLRGNRHLLVYGAPLILLVAKAYLGLLIPSAYESWVLGLTAGLFADRIREGRPQKAFVAIVVVLACALAWWSLPSSPNAEETAFGRLFVGQPIPSAVAPFREVAEALRSVQGMILLDDSHLYPVVALLGQPGRFILPYNYEFDAAVAAPARFAEYVVVYRGAGQDRIAAAWPGALAGELPGYYLMYEAGDIAVFRRR